MEGKSVYISSGRLAEAVGVIVADQGRSWVVKIEQDGLSGSIAVPKEHCVILDDMTVTNSPSTPSVSTAASPDRSAVHKEALKQIRDIIGSASQMSDAQLLTVYRQNAFDVERTVDALLSLGADGQSFPEIPLSPPPSAPPSTLNRSNGAQSIPLRSSRDSDRAEAEALARRREERAQQDREYQESLRMDQEKQKISERNQQHSKPADSPKELRLGPSENISREEMRARRLQTLSRTSQGVATGPQELRSSAEFKPPMPAPKVSVAYDDDVQMADVNDAPVSRAQLDADLEMARRLQAAEYDDDEVEVIGARPPSIIDVDSIENERDFIDISDGTPPRPSPRSLLQRISDIGNRFRRGGSLSDEQPREDADEELAQQLQEQLAREDEDARLALRLQREESDIRPPSVIRPPMLPGPLMSPAADPRVRAIMQRMLERDMRGLAFDEIDDDFDDAFDLPVRPPSPIARAPFPFFIPRGVGSMSYEHLLGLEAVPTPVSKSLLSQLPTFKFDGKNASDSKCSICLGDFEKGDELRRLSCLHCFHTACIDKWFETKNKCPVCQSEIK